MIGLSYEEAVICKMRGLKGALAHISERIWDQYGFAKSSLVDMHEESITQGLILSLAQLRTQDTKIYSFSKKMETKVGSDWIWAIRSASRREYLIVLVQAKRLGRGEEVYKSLNHKSGRPAEFQIERLIKTAKSLNIPAMYALYNHVSDGSSLALDCCESKTESIWGCSIALADDVKPFMFTKRFHEIYPLSFPLPCLICDDKSCGAKLSRKLLNSGGYKRIPKDQNRFDGILREIINLEETESKTSISRYVSEYKNVKGVIITRI